MTTTLQEPTSSPKVELPNSTPTPTQLGSSTDPNSAIRLGAFAVVLVSGLFFLTWWNQYLAPTSMHNIFFHHAAQQGQYPYRDYFHTGQPGKPAFAILFFSVVGSRVIYAYLFGIVVRLGALVCLYLLLTRFCKPTFAALSVITMHVASSGDQADTPLVYHHFQPVFAIYATYFAAKVFDNPKGWGYLWAVLAGIFLGMCFLVKQPAVLAVGVLGGFIALAVWKKYGLRQCKWSSLAGVIGFCLPVGGVFIWLAWIGAFDDYIHQAFLTGPKAKGGLRLALLRPFTGIPLVVSARVAAILSIVLIGIGWGLSMWSRTFRRPEDEAAESETNKTTPTLYFNPLALSVGLAMLILGMYQLYLVGLSSRTPGFALTLMGEFGCLALFLWFARKMVRGETGAKTISLALVSLCGFVTAFTLAMSCAVYEPMAAPGSAVVLACLFGLTPKAESLFRNFVAAMCVVVIVLGCINKWEKPYGWGGWVERPVGFSTAGSKLPELQGFQLDPKTAKVFDEVTEHIKKNTSPGEPIYTYPHLSVFHVLANRPLATFGRQHFWDVCPNDVAEKDAEHLKKHPPKVIVRMEFPEESHRNLELMYRGGEKSGQRKLSHVLDELLKSYDVVGTYRDDVPGLPVKVYVRRK